MTTRRCIHPQCSETIRDHELACRTHWYQLPIALRNRIWKHWRNNNIGAHNKAVNEALQVWTPVETTPRCQSCRRPEPDFTDVLTGKPLCILCARSTSSPTAAILVCAGCDRPSDFLVGLDSEPRLCTECTIDLLAQLETIDA